MTDPADRRALHEQNRLSWNEATRAHNSHKGDQAASFGTPGSKLFPEELALLGDLRGKRVVHLQCNSGQDTLSIAQLGAADVLGVDISDEAIAFATKLSADSSIPARFVRADLYDWLAEAGAGEAGWDIAFSSYGAVIWLSDLEEWARGIAGVLNPGGRFVLVDFHPFVGMLERGWSLRYDYSTGGRAVTEADGISDYVAESGQSLGGFEAGVAGFKNPYASHEFPWGTAEVVTALLEAGLVESFHEYPYANGWKGFERMREAPGRRIYPPEDLPVLPMMYSISARKPGG